MNRLNGLVHDLRIKFIGSMLACLSLATTAHAQLPQQAPSFPVISTATPISGYLEADAPGYEVIDISGNFHFISSDSPYETKANQAWVHSYEATDMAQLNYSGGSATLTTYDPFMQPGSYCYEIDKRATDPIPSPQEDDYCDVIGVWVDPTTNIWYGLVHDEFDFDPTGNPPTVNGIHFDRIMYATSSNSGATWALQDQIITNPFGYPYPEHQPASQEWNGGIGTYTTAEMQQFPSTFPNGVSWYRGDGDPRLFVDYAGGYFYVYYHNYIYSYGSSQLGDWYSVARSPISAKMAAGSWYKWDGTGWGQPGIGGTDGLVTDAADLLISNVQVAYSATTGMMTYSYNDEGGNPQTATSSIPSSGSVSFVTSYTGTQPAGTYTINGIGTSTPTISNSAGATFTSLSYNDGYIGQYVTVAINTVGSTQIPQVTFTSNKTGAKTVLTIKKNLYVFKTVSNNRLFGGKISEGLITTYNTYLGKCMAVDNNDAGLAMPNLNDTSAPYYIFSNTDLSNQAGWTLVGQIDSSTPSVSQFYNWIADPGSETSERDTGFTFRRYNGLGGNLIDLSFPTSSEAAGYADVPTPMTLVDSTGNPISMTATPTQYYTLTAAGGGQFGSKRAFIPVVDPNQSTAGLSGFFRIMDGTYYMYVTGSTVQEQRTVGAAENLGYIQPDYNAAANGGNGSAVGSDQWFFEPVLPNAPGSTQTPSGVTSLTTATQYKIVNRISGLVLSVNTAHQGSVQADTPPPYASNSNSVFTITPVAP